MKTLNKALFALSLLIAFPAINAMDGEAAEQQASAQGVTTDAAPEGKSVIAWAKSIKAQVVEINKTHYIAAPAVEGVIVVTAAGVVLYKKNAKFHEVVNNAVAKAIAGYEAAKVAGNSAVATVKANPKKSAAAAVVLAGAGFGAYVANQKGYLTFGKDQAE